MSEPKHSTYKHAYPVQDINSEYLDLPMYPMKMTLLDYERALNGYIQMSEFKSQLSQVPNNASRIRFKKKPGKS